MLTLTYTVTGSYTMKHLNNHSSPAIYHTLIGRLLCIMLFLMFSTISIMVILSIANNMHYGQLIGILNTFLIIECFLVIVMLLKSFLNGDLR